ncbi:hypothetical protein [Microlunatus parietis]|uniref:Putative membrane protein n=1 Tax=Microlunatus parietis TaxID=682979 RepID=A0A7Y9LC66_9ACTN|nr:hypothetical protein [Microlunatus parietis]NYE74534.1 putative membrane protein [Microlunatus parietis]
MPFLENAGPDDAARPPVWEAFAVVRDQVERLVAVNVLWSLNLAPGVLAMAFPGWPLGLRTVLVIYTVVVIVPLTGMLYGVAAVAAEGQHVGYDSVRDALRVLARPSLRALAPLYLVTAAGVIGWALARHFDQAAVVTLLTAALLIWTVPAQYWGPLLARDPRQSAMSVLRGSVRLALDRPGATLGCWLMVGAVLVVGVISIGGLVLIVPVVAVLLQTCFASSGSESRTR